jgi:hypothetical protein
MRRGDIRSSLDRSRWPIGWKSTPLLERAAATASHEVQLRIRHADPEVVSMGNGAWLVNDELVVSCERRRWATADQRPSGGLRYSGHRGRIISVR